MAAQPRILIAATPKTGTTWLRHLLGTLYDVPVVDLPPSPDFEAYVPPAGGWVIQSHLSRDSRISAWIRRHGVSIVTSSRHPGDVLVSMYHYVRSLAQRPETVSIIQPHEQLLARAETIDAPEVTDFIRHHLFYYLNHTLSWLGDRDAQWVRYEDLRHDPVRVIGELARGIGPVSRDKLERIVALNQIQVLRRWSDSGGIYFREGVAGGWRAQLSAEQVRLFTELQPYPTELAMMGYDMDPNNPMWSQPPVPPAIHNPFEEITHFDNGVPIPAVCIRLYFSVDTAEAARWQPVERVERANSFFRWLLAPAPEDDGARLGLPPITNLAAYIHAINPDLQARFPRLYGSDRIGFLAEYFLSHAQVDYQFDGAILESARQAFVAWANVAAKEDPHPARSPRITNLALHIYRQRPDHQVSCPDVFDRDRWTYASWFLRYAVEEYGVPPECVQPVVDSMLDAGARAARR